MLAAIQERFEGLRQNPQKEKPVKTEAEPKQQNGLEKLQERIADNFMEGDLRPQSIQFAPGESLELIALNAIDIGLAKEDIEPQPHIIAMRNDEGALVFVTDANGYAERTYQLRNGEEINFHYGRGKDTRNATETEQDIEIKETNLTGNVSRDDGKVSVRYSQLGIATTITRNPKASNAVGISIKRHQKSPPKIVPEMKKKVEVLDYNAAARLEEVNLDKPLDAEVYKRLAGGRSTEDLFDGANMVEVCPGVLVPIELDYKRPVAGAERHPVRHMNPEFTAAFSAYNQAIVEYTEPINAAINGIRSAKVQGYKAGEATQLGDVSKAAAFNGERLAKRVLGKNMEDGISQAEIQQATDLLLAIREEIVGKPQNNEAADSPGVAGLEGLEELKARFKDLPELKPAGYKLSAFEEMKQEAQQIIAWKQRQAVLNARRKMVAVDQYRIHTPGEYRH